MPIRSIVTYPHPALAFHCEPVSDFGPELAQLAKDLLETMRAAPGVGITAAHIGQTQRVFVLELKPGEVRTYVNPEIAETSQETMRHMEGSVSMPGVTEEVERPSRVKLRFQDLSGHWQEEQAEGFQAICIQHEVDQLNGMFWLRRLSKLKRDRLIRKWEKSRA
ncbi:peptide deformylase [Rhizobium skierniewicense]|uniref:peptide deformylase n=1 Tax=Rhizobium skierniewicense TaxID=984260 RepID=UPI0015746A94|nr:peptide deformylase [Rhizobium skierniewicense]NTF32112.1 peptide deformylase [Rhizobium skierniewicense]